MPESDVRDVGDEQCDVVDAEAGAERADQPGEDGADPRGVGTLPAVPRLEEHSAQVDEDDVGDDGEHAVHHSEDSADRHRHGDGAGEAFEGGLPLPVLRARIRGRGWVLIGCHETASTNIECASQLG